MKATPVDQTGPPLLTALAGPQCDVLFELSTGGLTRVYLGRMLSGMDAGRVVLLRKLPGPASSELRAAAERAQGIAHPKLAKALGVLRASGLWYIASEYIPGITLFELLRANLHRDQALSAAFAVRVVRDALQAADAATRLLGAANGVEPVRCLYPENIWVAEFGETFVSEVLVSESLAKDRGEPLGALEDDVASAGSLLLSLISGVNDESSLDDPEMPPAVAEIAARAFGLRGTRRFTSVAEFAEALSNLDPELIASEAEVSSELASLVGPALDIRRQKLQMSEREAEQSARQDETRFFRKANLSGGSTERDTARPPPDPAATSKSAPSRPARFDDIEEPTIVYRRPEPEPAAHLPAPIAARSPAPSAPAIPRQRALSVASLVPAPQSGAEVAAPAPRRIADLRVAAFGLLLIALAAFGVTSESARAESRTAAHAAWVWVNGVSHRVLARFR